MRGAAFAIGFLCLILGGGIGMNVVHAQPDSVRAAILKAKGFTPDHSPRGAVWRAVAVPGWGQLYNHQYYKIPFVYAGLGGMGYTIYLMNRNYLLYRRAHLFKLGKDPEEENPYQQYGDEYDEVTAQVGGDLQAGQLRRQRDKLRRWRDLSIVGTGLFYALTVLDAYVSAHLLTFNVGEDLALDVRPTGGMAASVRRAAGSVGAGGVGVRVRLQF